MGQIHSSALDTCLAGGLQGRFLVCDSRPDTVGGTYHCCVFCKYFFGSGSAALYSGITDPDPGNQLIADPT